MVILPRINEQLRKHFDNVIRGQVDGHNFSIKFHFFSCDSALCHAEKSNQQMGGWGVQFRDYSGLTTYAARSS